MLASPVDLARLRLPVIASCKLDGIRALAMDGRAMSRSQKPLPNRFVQAWFSTHRDALEGLDGELIVGDPTAKDAYNATVSAIMAEDGEPDFAFHVFDYWNLDAPYVRRLLRLNAEIAGHPRVCVLPARLIRTADELDAYEAGALEAGYEGVMLRDPQGPYKQGRSSVREGLLLKLKRHSDAEARVVGFEEEMENRNEKVRNELGLSRRSSHQDNKVGKDTLGALVVEGLTAFPGVRFNIGTGLTAQQRARMWRERDALLGRVARFKFFPIGCKDAPRHPVFAGWRDPIDMDGAA